MEAAGKNCMTAKVLRVVTVPPVMAAWLILALWFSHAGLLQRIGEVEVSLLCLSLLPLLAYPMSWILPHLRRKGRETQRNLAFLLSGIGYGVGWAYGWLGPCSRALRYIFSVYLLSVLVLLLFNKLLRLRASGHACAVAGPMAVIVYLLGGWWIPICFAVYGLSFWASVRSGRHSVGEYLLGTASVLIAMLLAALIGF